MALEDVLRQEDTTLEDIIDVLADIQLFGREAADFLVWIEYSIDMVTTEKKLQQFIGAELLDP
jgi:hypothetical protein